MEIVLKRSSKKIGKREKTSKNLERENKKLVKINKHLRMEVDIQKSEFKRMFDANQELFEEMVENEQRHVREMTHADKKIEELEEKNLFCTRFCCKTEYDNLKESYIRISQEKNDLFFKNNMIENEKHYIEMDIIEREECIRKLNEKLLDLNNKYEIALTALHN